MERFFVPKTAMEEDQAFIQGEELKHLAKVLRLQPGDLVEIFDGAGAGFQGRIETITAQVAKVRLLGAVTQQRESPLHTCLAQGIPKGEKMEWVVQKATELGVSEILPLEMSRSIVKLAEDKKRQERQIRWQKVAAEAARQCGRLTIPTVQMPRDLHSFLTQVTQKDLLLIPWEKGGQPLQPTLQELATRRNQIGCLYLMVGPEGGMTEAEVAQAQAKGGINVTLGPRILRTETAGLTLSSILQYELGDMGK